MASGHDRPSPIITMQLIKHCSLPFAIGRILFGKGVQAMKCVEKERLKPILLAPQVAEVVCQREKAWRAWTVGQLHLIFSGSGAIAQQLWGLCSALTADRCELLLPVFQDNQQLFCSYMAINNNLEPGDYEYKESLRDIRAGIKKALYLSQTLTAVMLFIW